MKNSAGFLIFVAGAAIGSAATWYYAKKKYEQIAQEEIDSVKERFTIVNNYVEPKDSDEDKAQKAADMAKEKPSVADYAKKLSKEGYTNYSNSETTNEASEKNDMVKEIPFAIPPEEFGDLEDEGYDKISLTYYADGVLTDEHDEVVEDIDRCVGEDFADHFGEYEDDSVFIRNHRLKADYEILYSQQTYEDVLKEKPYLRRYDE